MEMVEERLTATPTVAVIGVIGPAVRSGKAPAVTVTFVQEGEQLLPSLDSEITPAEAEFVLSAQARI